MHLLTANVDNMLTVRIFRDHSLHTIGAGKRAKMTKATSPRCISFATTWEMERGECARIIQIVGDLNRFHSGEQWGNNFMIFIIPHRYIC